MSRYSRVLHPFLSYCITLLLLGLLMLAACTSGEIQLHQRVETQVIKGATEQPTIVDNEISGGRQVVWMVRTNFDENPWEQDIVIPAFEAENPTIKVNLIIVDPDEIGAKREAMIAAGEPLHVWSPNWGGDGFASDQVRGLLADLTPLIERDNLDLSVFIPETLATYRKDGKIWGLPILSTGSYVFYNKALFDQAGLPYPPTDWDDKSWTWEAMVALGKQLTQDYDDPTRAVYGLIVARQGIESPALVFGQNPWPAAAYETGFAEEITLTSPEIIDAYQKHHDLIHVHRVSPDGAALAGLNALFGSFESGRVAMMQWGGWGWFVYERISSELENGFCWGAAPIPWGTPEAERRAILYTDPWSITHGLEGQALEDAWTLVKFLIREDNARAFMLATKAAPAQVKLRTEWAAQFECMDEADVISVHDGAFSHGLPSAGHVIVGQDETDEIATNLLAPYFDDPAGDTAATLSQIEERINAALSRIAEENGFSFE